MAQPSGFTSYLTQSVPVKRWELHVGRFLFMYASFFTSSKIFAPQVRLRDMLASALCVTTLGLIADRYRDRFASPRLEWVKISLLLAAIIVLLLLVWRHEANKPNYEDSRGTAITKRYQQTS